MQQISVLIYGHLICVKVDLIKSYLKWPMRLCFEFLPRANLIHCSRLPEVSFSVELPTRELTNEKIETKKLIEQCGIGLGQNESISTVLVTKMVEKLNILIVVSTTKTPFDFIFLLKW